jgi:hypothetical protein
MEEVEFYAEQAHNLKATHKALADTYIKIAEEHIGIYKMLHDRMVELIEEEKRKGNGPSQEMLAIWNYEHEALIKEFSKNKFLVEEYKKAY